MVHRNLQTVTSDQFLAVSFQVKTVGATFATQRLRQTRIAPILDWANGVCPYTDILICCINSGDRSYPYSSYYKYRCHRKII